MVFHALTFTRSRGRCWKPRPEAAVFNTSLGTWRVLLHRKNMFDRYYCINTENICYISCYFLHYFVSPFHWCLANAISTVLMHRKNMFDRYYCILKTFATFRVISCTILFRLFTDVSRTPFPRTMLVLELGSAGQCTSHNGSKSVTQVRSYWKLRSRALTTRELPC